VTVQKDDETPVLIYSGLKKGAPYDELLSGLAKKIHEF
jgi:hypothetical protein